MTVLLAAAVVWSFSAVTVTALFVHASRQDAHDITPAPTTFLKEAPHDH